MSPNCANLRKVRQKKCFIWYFLTQFPAKLSHFSNIWLQIFNTPMFWEKNSRVLGIKLKHFENKFKLFGFTNYTCYHKRIKNSPNYSYNWREALTFPCPTSFFRFYTKKFTLKGIRLARSAQVRFERKNLSNNWCQSKILTQLSNLWWMPNSVGIGFSPTMKTGSSRRFKRYPTTYRWVSSWIPFTVD